MRELVIPDIHLKPSITDAAEEIYRQHSPDAAVFPGDIPDDWVKQNYRKIPGCRTGSGIRGGIAHRRIMF